MLRYLSIRTKVILGVVAFTVILFSLVQYQHNSKVKQQVLHSEQARNTLLVDTIIPVLVVNYIFGLNAANADYLESIALKNQNIVSISLENMQHKIIYSYTSTHAIHNEKHFEHSVIRRALTDDVTHEHIGYIEFHFSNVYYNQLMREHYQFILQFFLIMLLLLGLFILYLRHAFTPLKTLLGQVEKFEPQKNNFQFNVSTQDNEIGIIQDAIIDMIKRITLYTHALDELNQDLEQKVETRTNKLRQQKDELEHTNKALALKIGEVKKQEDMLIAQSRLAAMGEMMSMIAHQWRQPLSTTSLMISNYTIKSMLSQDKTYNEEDEHHVMLKDISDTLCYLSSTIDDFQTYFKPEHKVEEALLCEVIQRSIQFTQARLKPYSITLDVQCAERLSVKTYINELVQVLINIINNAIDAIIETRPDKKQITLKTREEEKNIVLSIRDSGGGIPENVITKIFEPYFSTKSKNGTGLGLYMTKMIIDKHTDGKISVRNIDGGAEFTIYFPKNSNEA